VLERAVMFSSNDEIDPEALSGFIGAGGAAAPAALPAQSVSPLMRVAAQGIVATTAVPGVFRVEPAVRPAAPSPSPGAGQAVLVPEAESGVESVQVWPTLADVERLHVERTLAATMHNKSLAAKLLGIDRSVLRRKLQRYGRPGPSSTEPATPAALGPESTGP
ncbi:hypothetical protein EBR56_03075, partial [bacterium]|nr:hypothetical protein [bacterium]